MRTGLLSVLGMIVCVSSCAAVEHSNQKQSNPVTVPSSCTSVGCPIDNPHPRHVQLLTEVTTTAHCPNGMVYVEGDYCPTVKQTCLYAVDVNGNKISKAKPVIINGRAVMWPDRCGEWQYPTQCLSKHKVHKAYCIDKYEYPNIAGHIPQAWLSWNDMKATCESEGKRLCTRSEWTFACEGPDMKPYPYGDGYHRDRNACNFDNPMPEDPERPVNPRTGKHFPIDVFKATSPTSRVSGILNSLLVPSGSKPQCVSPFGVYDMVGNVDESVVNETHHPHNSGLAGGHVFGVRNACRPMTEAHGEGFAWYETGGRCCENAKE